MKNRSWIKIFSFPFIRVRVSGNSMLPTLFSGQEVIGYRWFLQVHVDDIVILRDPRDKRLLVKRILKIDDNRYFVEGDNKTESTDSRIFGWITRTSIVGKVLYL